MVVKNLKSILAIAFLFFFSQVVFGQHNIVLTTDFDGNVTKGSKEQLINEIRKGKSVRVGYQLDFDNDKVADFDHWLDAEFITILNGEVFTQIRNINLQIPNMEDPQIDIIPVNTMWTAILGTNSILKNRFVYDDLVPDYDEDGNPIIDEKMEKEIAKRDVQTWKVATIWVVE